MPDINRRTFLQSASAALVLASGCVAPTSRTHPVTDPTDSWPTFRQGQYNTGYARGAQDLAESPTVAWTVETDDEIWGSPVVSDDTVYIGSADATLYALDADSGEVQWRYRTDHRIEGAPAVADGTVYVGSYDRTIYALDAETGDERWSHETDGLIRASPTVVGNAVYIGVGCFNLACSWYADEDTPEVGWLYSLDRETGELNWRYETDGEVVSTPAVTDGTVYVGSSDERLYALDAATGDREWVYEANDWIWSSPSVAFGSVFFGDYDGDVIAVDARTGEQQWRFDTFGAYVSGSTAVDEDTVYVGVVPGNYPGSGERNDAEVFALERETGDERWRFETDVLEIGSSPVVTDDAVYIGSHSPVEESGTGVHAISTDGDERWHFDVGNRGVGSSPALVDGTLYVGGTDGVVYALR
ncbi:PQQ-binding-like beta-propeller repeat protein [Natrialbaceae archaeon A-arb3/5]